MNLALFDFDGTITDREMFASFLELAFKPGRRLAGRALLAPLVAGYKLGLVPGDVIRAVAVQVGLTGVPLATVESCGRTFAAEVLPAVIRPEALERIAWHKAQGDRVIVVSGALELALAPWCASHELELIGSRLAHRDGLLTGRYRGPQCVRAEKVRRIRERYDLARYGTIYAYGDTLEDFAMLALADKRYYRWQEQPTSVGAGDASGAKPVRDPA